MIRVRPSPVLLTFAVLSLGCEPASTPAPTFTVRDSAGIEIVESTAPLLGPDAWTISEEPVLQIGEVEGDDPYLFAGIDGSPTSSLGKVFRLGDDRIVVCNEMDSTIRFFDVRGDFVKQIGGKGEGPGEFNRIWSCSPETGGFAVLSSPNNATLFDKEGNLLKSVRISPIENRRALPTGVFSDGSFLASSGGPRTAELGPGITPRRQDLSSVSPDGLSSEFLFEMNTSLWNSDTNIGLVEFGPIGLIGIREEEVLYAWPEQYQIQTYDLEGHPVRMVRRAWELAPVTEEDQQWARDFYVNRNSLRGRVDTPEQRRGSQRIAEQMAFSEHHAVFDKLHVDQTGNLWVRQRNPRWNHAYWAFNVHFPDSWAWDVFDPEGRWVTSVTPPNSMEIHDIGEDYILGVWKDEMDVEFVRMYSLERGG